MPEEKRRRRKPSNRPPPQLLARGSSHPSAVFNLPPLKIIKSNTSYQAKTLGELSFEKDEFFYVIAEKPEVQCYEVINPILRVRGLVHTFCFDNVKRSEEPRIDSRYSTAGRRVKSEVSSFWKDGESAVAVPPSHNLGYVEVELKGRKYASETDAKKKLKSPTAIFDSDSDGNGKHTSKLANNDEIEALQREFDDVLSPDFLSSAGTLPKPVENPDFNKDGLYFQTAKVAFIDPYQNDYILILHVKYTNGEVDIYERTIEELWDLHMTLLNKFPIESGLEDEPRIIPFLPEPIGKMNSAEIAECQRGVNEYLKGFFRLPPDIVYCDEVLDFFVPGTNDVENATLGPKDKVLPDIKLRQNEINLRLGDESFTWTSPRDILYNKLFQTVEDKLGFQFDNILYMDEYEQLIKLFDDEDWKLLKNLPEIKLYVS